jgi:hypothetical protein
LERQVTDQEDVITSDAVIGEASRVLGMEGSDLRELVTVDIQEGNSRIIITATGPDAERVTATTATVTEAYVDYVQTAGAEALRRQADLQQPTVDRLTGEVQAANDELARVDRELADSSASDAASTVAQSRAARAATRSADAQTRLADILALQESLRAASEDFTGEAFVMRQASEPEAPSSLSLPVALILGGGLGFFIGLCAVFFLLGRRRSSASPPGRRP